MKKLLTFFMMSILAIGVGWAADVSYTINSTSPSNWSSNSGIITTNEGFTIAIVQNANEPAPNYSKANYVGVNQGNNVTISHSTATITKVTLTQYDNNGSASNFKIRSSGSGSISDGVWSGSSNSVNLYYSTGKQFHLSNIAIEYTIGSSTTYAVNIATLTNGSVTASPNPAQEGATVTLTANPASGYSLSNISATNHSTSETITLSGSGNTRTFTMPGAQVDVSATFHETADVSYRKITTSAGLIPGKTYIIATADGKTVPNTGRVAVAMTVDNNVITVPEDNTTVGVFTLGTSGDNYTLKLVNEDFWLKPATNSTGDIWQRSASPVSITIETAGNAKIGNLASSDERFLRQYNASGGADFRSYSDNSGNPVYLYKIDEPEAPTYAINIPTMTGGSVAATVNNATATEAVAGATVTLTATPLDGYELSSITVTDADNDPVTVTGSGNTRTFTMPGKAVTVNASFEAIHYSINTEVLPSEAASQTPPCEIWIPSELNEGIVFVEDNVSKSTVGKVVTFRMHTETGWVVPSDYLPTVTYSGGTCTVTRKSTQDDGATFSFTMPAADVTISATFTDYAEPLWLLGNNLEGEMSYNGGTPFTYADGNYTLTTYFKGNNPDNGVYGAFTLTKKNDANSWDDLNESGKRIGPKDGNNVVINASYPTKDLSVNTNSFWIPAGIYTITVNKACTSVTITPITGYGVTLSPNGGNVETGSSVTASETLSAALKAINSDLSDNCATLALSLDGGNTFVNGASHEFSNSDEGPKSVVGKATYGHIEAISAPASFTVTRADNSNKYQLVTSTAGLTPNKKYIIVATVGSDNYLMGANNGSKNASVSSGFTLANDVVTITSATGVEYLTLIEDEGKYYLRNNSNEYYSVSSSSGNTNITTSSTETQVYITFDSSSPYFARIAGASGNNRVIGFQTQNSANVFGAYSNPSASGQQRAIYLYKQMKTGKYTITYADDLTGGTVGGTTDADKDDQVEVTVTPDATHVVGTVTYTPQGGSATEITPNSEGKYIFTMPAANVTVSATFVRAHNITGVASPTAGGTVTASPNPATYNQRVDIAITPADDYELSGTPTYAYGSSNNNPLYGNSSNGWYLMMPGYDVTVNATFVHKQHTITLVNASDRGTVTGLPAAERTGETVNFTVTPSSSNYAVNTVTVMWDETEDGGGTGTVPVTAGSNGSYSFTMPAHNVTVNVTYIVPFVSSDYQLIKSVDDLEAGRDYLIANSSGSAVMGKMQSGYAAAVSTTGEPHGDNNDIISSTEDMAVVTLGGSEGAWTLQTIQGYLHNNGNTKNSLSAGDTPGYATISINGSSGGAATVTFTEPGTYNQLQYNSDSPRFAAYNGGQNKVYFYKETNTNKVKLPVATDRGSFIGVDVVTLTCATADATIWYTTDGSDPSDTGNSARRQYSEPFEITASAYQEVVTVKAYAVKDGMEDSDVRTARFTCGRPDAPTFGNNTPGAYVNPMFVYPKRSTSNYSTYGVGEDREAAFTYYYTLDGSEPTIDAAHKVDGTESSVPVGKNSNGPFIYMDKDATLKAIVVINGIPSESAGGEYTFSVAAPVSSLEAGTYDGSTTTRLSTETKTQQNNKSWRTYIYYSFADNPTWVEGVDWVTNSAEELGISVTNEDWTRYDADNAPFITIPYGTHTLSAVTVSEYMNGKEKFVSSTIATTEYTITEANLAIMFTPKPGHYVNSQNVTLNASNPVGAVHIYYTLGDEASDFTYYRDNVNSSEILVEDGWIEYTGTPILMESGITRIRVAAFDQRGDDVTGHLATRDEVFEIGVQPVTFSPIGSEDSNNPANYYSGNQTLEMYSVSPKARVYYAIAEASGTVPPAAPATPDLNSLRYSDDVTINLEAGKSYAVTAVAYVGRTPSAPRTVYYTIYNADNNIQDIATMNNMSTGVTSTLSNPVQVVYMSTHQHDGETPEFAYVRDNSGYGLIYFGNGLSKYKGLKIFERGDWIAGDVIKSKTAVWSDGFINEFGSRNGDVDKDLWPTDKIGHTPILPETMTNARIMEGWDADAYASSTATGSAKYAAGVKENNVWGHYVHLRKNTIDVKTTVSGKYQGIITDESGVSVTYYDGFYNFSNYGTGENATPNYDKEYFDDIKNNGGTVDVYGVVGFYGPLVDNSTYKNNPMEIFPIAFATIYKPMYNINPEEGQIYREPQTISLTCQSVGAQIWYKTSEMEGFELYTNPFTVEHSTTIEAYSTLVNEEFNDELESVVNTLVLNIGEVAQPVISPNSEVKAVGDDAVNCTITCDTEGAVIYYTTDGSDPSDENGTREIYTEPLSFSTTTTVRAIAEEGGYYSTEAESRTYTFVYSNGIVFDLVTDESQLDESSVYIIVNQESHMAMSNAQKENNRGATGVMFVDEATKARVYGNADVALFTLRKYGNNFQFYTTNGLTNAADGYLCVGNGNKLLTESAQDNEANCDATIEITSDNKAHIHFLYNSEVDRYLRFWKRDNLFNCYTTESNGDVYLYRVMATPLATIEEFGTTVEGKNQYTIADELVCVWQSSNHLWCKDQGNVSIWRTAPLEGQEDFMMNHSTYGANRLNKTWDQSNWVRIDFDNTTSGFEAARHCVGHLLDAATISALFIDKNNYTMSLPGNAEQELTKVKEVASKEATREQLELNVYGPANFLEKNLRLNANDQGARGSDGKDYYLVNPKVQEVCIITWAVWDSESNQFVIPKAEGTNNLCNFDGAISIGTWEYNSVKVTNADLVDGEAYTFTAVVESVGNDYGPARIKGKEGQTASSNVTVSPLNFNPNNPEQIVTDVQAVKTGREVAGVTYYNVAGQMSKTPFEGSVNIVVTKYTDGTKKTAKVVF